MPKMGVCFQHMTHGLRNSIEQWFGLLKARTKGIHNSFPYRSSPGSLRSWTNAFAGFYQLDKQIVCLEEVLS